MSLHEEVAAAIQQELDNLGTAVKVKPTTLALAVQKKFVAGNIEPHIQYTSLEHLKQMARGVLSGRYDTSADNSEAYGDQGSLFSGHLQDRYPVPRKRGDDPEYVKLSALTKSEWEWNVRQLRKAGRARLSHADALEAWGQSEGVGSRKSSELEPA